ncbi:hypothetical protein M2373_001088 [Chryseobacterium sp. JUb7]|nr:hypothetical protein [Chryseobacterium sp. JUb7]
MMSFLLLGYTVYESLYDLESKKTAFEDSLDFI